MKENQLEQQQNEIAIIGLGKMGQGIAKQLKDKGWRVIVHNRSKDKIDEFAKEGFIPAYSQKELVSQFEGMQKVVWVMVPAGKAVDDVLFGEDGLIHHLSKGDIVIDAGNSQYKNDKPRAEKLSEKGIEFVDVGVSGGPAGARNGACLMIGGSTDLFEKLEPIYKAVSVEKGYEHFSGIGAGHFVKMVHNGIEYGMMQAIGEGFNIMKKSEFNPDLKNVASVYNHASVIESRLVGWLMKAYEEYGEDLESISGSVNSTGEGEWTVKAGEEMGEPVPVIKESFEFRQQSKDNPSYVGKVVSALRGQFGGHSVKK